MLRQQPNRTATGYYMNLQQAAYRMALVLSSCSEEVRMPQMPQTNPTHEQLENWFTYHPPNQQQAKAYETIRGKAFDLANVIANTVPDVADRLAAIRLLREAVMTANAGIACGDVLGRGASVGDG